MKTRRLTPLLLAFLAAPAFADVKLPAIISDNMVLQQDTPAGVWGSADPGEKVTVKFAGKSVEATTGQWQVCTPQTVPGFSAVGYFFARRVYQTLKQPIGIIHTSWGGTPAELWTPKPVLTADPAYKGIIDGWANTVANYPQAK